MRKHLTTTCLYFIALWSGTAAELPAWKQRLMPKSDAWKSCPQEFIYNNGAEPESLDPALITGVPEMRLVRGLFEGLADLDPETLEPRPGLARSWEISAAGLTYTFHLRPAAKWSNGRQVTALDVRRSWRRVLTPATGASYAYQLYPIRGAAAFHRGRNASFDSVGVTAVDAVTLRVELAAPCSYFLDLVAFPTLFPVPVDVVARHGDRWTLPENLVCNGPYRLLEWQPRQRVVLTRNPHYWDRAFCRLERIVALPYDDLDTAYKLYVQGKLHWLSSVPLAKLDEVRRNPDYYVAPYLGTYFYRFNVTQPPFDDARVRRAFCQGFDRRVITRQILRGGQQPTGALCPPVAGYQPVKGLEYAPEAARTLLAAAGYGDGGKALPPVEILYNTSEAHKQVAESLAQQWKRNLGVTVSLRNAEWKVYLADMEALDYTIARSSWIGDYGDPNTFFDMWVTDGGNNRTGWSNKRYDALLARSRIERDAAKRRQLFREMEELLVKEECPIMPIYFYVNQGLLAESVLGWYQNVRDIHPFKYLWMEP